MFFPFQNYKVINTNYSGSNDPRIINIYTTTAPCLLFMEVITMPGYKGQQSCYFEITYPGGLDGGENNIRTWLLRNRGRFDTPISDEGTIVGYCPKAGVSVLFDIADDDYFGTTRLHVLELPPSGNLPTS